MYLLVYFFTLNLTCSSLIYFVWEITVRVISYFHVNASWYFVTQLVELVVQCLIMKLIELSIGILPVDKSGINRIFSLNCFFRMGMRTVRAKVVLLKLVGSLLASFTCYITSTCWSAILGRSKEEQQLEDGDPSSSDCDGEMREEPGHSSAPSREVYILLVSNIKK